MPLSIGNDTSFCDDMKEYHYVKKKSIQNILCYYLKPIVQKKPIELWRIFNPSLKRNGCSVYISSFGMRDAQALQTGRNFDGKMLSFFY